MNFAINVVLFAAFGEKESSATPWEAQVGESETPRQSRAASNTMRYRLYAQKARAAKRKAAQEVALAISSESAEGSESGDDFEIIDPTHRSTRRTNSDSLSEKRSAEFIEGPSMFDLTAAMQEFLVAHPQRAPALKAALFSALVRVGASPFYEGPPPYTIDVIKEYTVTKEDRAFTTWAHPMLGREVVDLNDISIDPETGLAGRNPFK